METVLKFDRVILTKELNGRFKKVGEAFEIANILVANESANIESNFFLLRDAKTRVAVGVVSLEDFERCFVKEENYKGWTPWTSFTGYDGQNDVLYRTNRRKTQVKFARDNVRAESCCCADDEFNLGFGVQIAYLRCLNKVLSQKKKEAEDQLKRIKCDIAENNTMIGNMISSLEV